MAQPQQNLSLSAPAFQGINTEDSPLTQDITFAARANNAVIDEYGRIGSRRGFRNYATSVSFAGVTPPSHDSYTYTVGSMAHSEGFAPSCAVEFRFETGGSVTDVVHYLCTIDTSTNTLTVGTHATSLTSKVLEAQIVFFANLYYVFTAGESALELDPATGAVTKLKDGAGFLAPQDDSGNLTNGDITGDVACAAYGRLWVTGVDGDYQKIWYSDLNDGRVWYDGKAAPTDPLNTAGGIEVSEYWPAGRDRIVAIRAWNNMLAVFGRNSILMYGNPQGDPASVGGIFLQDAIDGIGLVSRDAVTSTGSDLLYVDDSGVRSLGRTVQEQSAVIGDLTANIRTDISDKIRSVVDKESIKIGYWPEDSLVVVAFGTEKLAYVLEASRPSSTGGWRVTSWSNLTWQNMLHVEDADANFILMGGDGGLKQYIGGSDQAFDGTEETFKFEYISNPISFGDQVRQKFPKRMDLTIISRDDDTVARARWGFGGSLQYSKTLNVEALLPAYWGAAEYGSATYGEGAELVRRYRVHTKGSGALITLGVDATMDGGFFSLQELNIQTLLGRIY